MDKPSFYNLVPPRRQLSVSSKTKNIANEVLARDQDLHHYAKDFYLAPEEKTDLLGYGLGKSDDGHSFDLAQTSITPIRKPRASFSGFSHAVDDLRSIPRRLASQRRKGFLLLRGPRGMKCNEPFDEVPFEDEKLASELLDVGQDAFIQPRPLRWLPCCLSMRFRHRRRTIESPLRPNPPYRTYQEPPIGPVPGSGAAARAAAAAQNEAAQSEAAQNESAQDEASEYFRKVRTKERNIRGDSESGIGIDMRTEECVTPIIRRGMTTQDTHPSSILSHFTVRSTASASKGVDHADPFLS